MAKRINKEPAVRVIRLSPGDLEMMLSGKISTKGLFYCTTDEGRYICIDSTGKEIKTSKELKMIEDCVTFFQ